MYAALVKCFPVHSEFFEVAPVMCCDEISSLVPSFSIPNWPCSSLDLIQILAHSCLSIIARSPVGQIVWCSSEKSCLSMIPQSPVGQTVQCSSEQLFMSTTLRSLTGRTIALFYWSTHLTMLLGSLPKNYLYPPFPQPFLLFFLLQLQSSTSLQISPELLKPSHPQGISCSLNPQPSTSLSHRFCARPALRPDCAPFRNFSR